MSRHHAIFLHAASSIDAPVAGTVNITPFQESDYIAREIQKTQTFYEIDLLEHIATRAPLGGVYLDVGANIGNHASYFARFMADHVIAVEPHPLLAPILRRNLQENAVATFSSIHCAVGAAPTTGEITRPPGYTDNIGGTQIRVLSPSTPQQSDTTVAVQTLDNLIAGRRPELRGRSITLLKMDVEGMELDALRGAVNLLREHHPHIVVELATETSRADVRTLLAQFGYRDTGLRFGFTPTYHFIIPGLHELRPETPRCRDAFVDMLIDITAKLETLIPQGARYILADLDEWAEGLPLDGRRQIPFIETDGSYDGPPGTDEDALGELHRQIAAGAQFLVLGSPAFWMLETFPGFAEQLKAFGPPLHADDNMKVYDLRRNQV